MRQYFSFNGHKSMEYGLYINGDAAYNAPERDTEDIEIPGRSGTLTVDNGRWRNISVSYKVFVFGAKATQHIDAIREWLLTAIGYTRLEDSYHTDSYRMARYSGNIEWDVNLLAQCGEATLTFECWPQRYLKTGETAQTVKSGGKLSNPTACPALPVLVLTLTGSAKLQVGSTQVAIEGYTGQMTIDCNLQDAYTDGKNLNQYITAPDFPILEAGTTQISWTGGISSLSVTPRWWTL